MRLIWSELLVVELSVELVVELSVELVVELSVELVVELSVELVVILKCRLKLSRLFDFFYFCDGFNQMDTWQSKGRF